MQYIKFETKKQRFDWKKLSPNCVPFLSLIFSENLSTKVQKNQPKMAFCTLSLLKKEVSHEIFDLQFFFHDSNHLGHILDTLPFVFDILDTLPFVFDILDTFPFVLNILDTLPMNLFARRKKIRVNCFSLFMYYCILLQ